MGGQSREAGGGLGSTRAPLSHPTIARTSKSKLSGEEFAEWRCELHLCARLKHSAADVSHRPTEREQQQQQQLQQAGRREESSSTTSQNVSTPARTPYAGSLDWLATRSFVQVKKMKPFVFRPFV
ncbi:hypothetical protein Dda_3773 [Drechslerella dactyloides]|uniref:Uncharacterized protein n=1 Tax=Drechslerella dactyloides TaxID=74499 RepID=A0AAD6IYJ8_DREDA|nr:hypothetical protein Dda_3773 [Drechslerella dactyloides]